MTDREKVIKALTWCIKKPCHPSCPYFTAEDESQARCLFSKILPDALALLKEQEAVKRTSRTGANGYSLVWTCGNCGSDLHPNNAKAKYCSNCGKAVKWDD